MSKKQRLCLIRIIASFILLIIISVIPSSILPFGNIFKLILFLIPYLLSGYDVLLSSLYNICHGEIFDEKFLMSLATVGAFCIGEYPEGVAVMVFYQLGELFQSIAVGKSRGRISSLTALRPDSATVIRNEKEESVSVEEVKVGDILLVRPGERIGVDGIIIDGETSIDTSCITGESVPRQYGVGDKIAGGCLNLSGVIRMRAENEYTQSTSARILELVENAAEKKSKAENFITKFSRYYTPVVVISALLLAVLPPLLLKQPFDKWIYRALSFLVVSCPCAIVVSVPLAFFGGVGACSSHGILVKGTSYLELLARADTFVFDKTGTVTKGVLSVKQVVAEGITEETLTELCAYCESYSNHPIATAIKDFYGKEINVSRLGEIKELAGYGVSTVIDGEEYFAGNIKLMKKCGVTASLPSFGDCTVYVCTKGKYLGCIVLGDEIKEKSAFAIASLKQHGVKKTYMLSGDNASVVEETGRVAGIDLSIGELLPEQKVSKLEEIISQSNGCVFVGDGINDAAALTRADIGIAMGGIGSDAAIECADIVIMNDDLSLLPLGIETAKKTVKISKQNIIFSLAVKLLILIFSALGVLGMWMSVFGDVGVAVIAVLNSMRVLKKEKKIN